MIYEKGLFCTVPTNRLKELDHFEQSVLLWICIHSGQSGKCWPSIATLVDETKMSRSKLFQVLTSLEEKKIIERAGELGQVNDYHLIITSPSDGRVGIHDADGGRPSDGRVPVHEVDTELNSIELNKRTKTETEFVDSQAHQPTPSEEAERFFNSQDWQGQVITKMVESGYDHEFVSREVKSFVSYWTEPSKNGRRVRWQIEKTFEVRRRLVTWLNRATDKRRGFGAKPSQQWHVVN